MRLTPSQAKALIDGDEQPTNAHDLAMATHMKIMRPLITKIREGCHCPADAPHNCVVEAHRGSFASFYTIMVATIGLDRARALLKGFTERICDPVTLDIERRIAAGMSEADLIRLMEEMKNNSQSPAQ